MSLWRRALFIATLFFAICFLGFLLPAFSQQADSSVPSPGQSSVAVQSQSLGDVARKLRKDTTTEVKITNADTKKLFESVDEIFAFAAEDTGMPKHPAIKRHLLGKPDVEKHTTARLPTQHFTHRS